MNKKLVIDFLKSYEKRPENWRAIVDLFELKFYKKNSILCRKGDFPNKIYFVKSGFVRGFFTDEKGVDFNKLFFCENHLFASLSSLLESSPSKIILQCLTDCYIFEADYLDFKNIVERDIELANLFSKVLHLLYKDLESSEIDKVTLTAKERYLKVLETYPDIENRIMLYHIASHLGVTPIQLSRIRKELVNKTTQEEAKKESV